MNKKSKKNTQQVTDIEEIAEKASHGEDVSSYFTNKYVTKQRIHRDFPIASLHSHHEERRCIGIALNDHSAATPIFAEKSDDFNETQRFLQAVTSGLIDVPSNRILTHEEIQLEITTEFDKLDEK